VLADAANTGPTSPLSPPGAGFTPARAAVGVLTGSTLRCGQRTNRENADVKPPSVTAYRQA
jgi:hypothetical protein